MKPTPSYTLQQVALHKSATDCWVTMNNKVYDITPFLADHPGGMESILDRATSSDLHQLMDDPDMHQHSQTAYDILDTYQIGTLNTHHHSDSGTDLSLDPAPFLDIHQPLFWQMLTCKFSKDFYLTQVHIPRYLSKPATIFANPVLELFTRTPWYVVPTFWVPVVAYLFMESSSDFKLALYVIGMLTWTFFEYTFHRFLFHVDAYLPDNQAALTVHFLMHGIHHFLPMDKLRLVLPPIFFAIIVQPPWFLFRAVFSYSVCCGLFSGGISGYILYDLIHYYLHHATVRTSYFRSLKTYHLAHHYQEFDAGFGITSKFWDFVFNTVLLVQAPSKHK